MFGDECMYNDNLEVVTLFLFLTTFLFVALYSAKGPKHIIRSKFSLITTFTST